jgi:hypothetical protein
MQATMFNLRDINLMASKGISMPVIDRQIDHFITGFPYIRLAKPATVGDGIEKFTEKEVGEYSEYFENKAPAERVVKFVPASGAASRMFKHLFEFQAHYTRDEFGHTLFNKDQGFNSVYFFINHLDQTAFFSDLSSVISRAGMEISRLLKEMDFGTLIGYLLDEQGLNYANLPKALLLFHKYPEGPRTAALEHLVESAAYARDGSGIARIHFTISPEHREKFTALIGKAQPVFESRYDVKFEVTYSIQKPSTDTIAVDESNNPFRNPDGSLLFRPGGHGALIGNLNELNASLVFIKNIDNIVPDHLKFTTYKYKKCLGGYLLALREEIHRSLKILKEGRATTEELTGIASFASERLHIDLPPGLPGYQSAEQARLLFSLLNRPLRVCGMVKNEGEPGGGPFWVSDTDGRVSLQIVESSQIDQHDTHQKKILGESTHFNPVDLVCSFRTFEGKSFDLMEFIDENTGFISLKSSGGKTIKAQELPGLWNGAMAKWITIFVEVPIITFNPVKTVNDLLRKEHLPPDPS